MSTMSIEKRKPQDLQERADTAATPDIPVVVPRGDIHETANDVVLVLDMPGVDAGSVDVTLEQDLLTVSGRSVLSAPAGFNLAYQEYVPTGFRREFRLSTEVDREQIHAQVKDGVLTLTLPKVEQSKPRKIAVNQG